MNEAYKVIDNKVIVYDEYDYEHVRELTNNIEEILITENNIEEITELITKEEWNMSKRETMETVAPAWLGIATSQLILSIPKFITNNIVGAIVHLFSSICFFTATYFSAIKPARKRKEISNIKINFLEEKRDKEYEKLDELNKNKINDLIFTDESYKIISRDYKIEMLKKRLWDIKFYVENKQKLIKLYKEGLLEGELFEGCASRDTINFIIELAKNDTCIESKKQKKKVKQYENDIEYGNI